MNLRDLVASLFLAIALAGLVAGFVPIAMVDGEFTIGYERFLGWNNIPQPPWWVPDAIRHVGVAQIGGGIFGTPTPASVVVASVTGGGVTTKIGGTACTTGVSSTNAAGSLIERLRAKTPSLTNPVLGWIRTGRYDECVAINSITDVSLLFEPGAILRPTVVADTSVVDGALKIGNDSVIRGVQRVSIVSPGGGVIQNDAWSAPEPAVAINIPCPATAASYTDLFFWGMTIIGNHDGLQWCGDRSSSATTTDLPRIWGQNLRVISGADAIAKKGNGIERLEGITSLTMTNYCETATETFLPQQTGTVVSGTATTFEVDAADGVAPDHLYACRRVVFTDAAGGPCGATDQCDGVESWIVAYDTDAGNGTATVASTLGCAEAFTSGCTYTIDAVARFDEAPCRDMDWSEIRAIGGETGMFWKETGFHFGNTGPTVSSTLDFVLVKDWQWIGQVNDCSPSTSAQGNFAGILAYQTPNYRNAVFEDADLRLEVNAGMRSNPSVQTVACASITTSADFDGAIDFSGDCRIDNPTDADVNVRGFVVDTATNGDLNIRRAYVDINNTVGGYTGTSTTLYATTNALNVGDLTSADVITTEGANITGWAEKCFSLPAPDNSWVAGTDNQPIPISDAQVGLQVAYVGCRCVGSCGASNGSLDFTDDAGNVFATAVACVEPTGDMTWTDVRADVDALLPAAKSPQYDTNAAPTTAADDLQVCLRYTTTRWNP